ncbi:MAG: hypothetical protein JSV16_13725 [Candidatus Hydrogenedentota bacterium]|nr:MAG: hypothetical protein JSV16_13725 [Candidatus Hydrogenedentota bacterium]
MAQDTTIRKGCIILLLALLAGCSSANKPRIPTNPDPLIRGELTEDKARRALEMKLAKEINFLEQNRVRYEKQVVAVPSGDITYYYKYYDEFPEGAENKSITIIPTETFSPSYKAEAKYRKVRYQTRYTKSKSRAAADNDFIRDEGMQKNIYEFNGKTWQLKSSVFEVIKSSVYREDQWVASRGRIRRVEEEKPEYFVDKVRTLFGLLD